jgi:hypothetical protein
VRRRAKRYGTLRIVLVDRFDCTAVLVAGTCGYTFTGDGTFGGLLAASSWPTTFGGPNRDSIAITRSRRSASSRQPSPLADV